MKLGRHITGCACDEVSTIFISVEHALSSHLNLIIVFPMASDDSACWKASSASCGAKILSTTGCKLPSSKS
jgi:hypothetical protein